MKTTFNTLATILTISAVVFAASTASAGDGGNKKGNKKDGGGFSIGFGGGGSGVGYSNDKFGVYLGGGNNNNNHHHSCNNGGGYGGGYGNGGVYNQNGQQPFGQAYEPFHSTYICLPGDNFYTVSLKAYSTSANQAYIASFNGLPERGPAARSAAGPPLDQCQRSAQPGSPPGRRWRRDPGCRHPLKPGDAELHDQQPGLDPGQRHQACRSRPPQGLCRQHAGPRRTGLR